MQLNAHALVHSVHRAHRAGGTLMDQEATLAAVHLSMCILGGKRFGAGVYGASGRRVRLRIALACFFEERFLVSICFIRRIAGSVAAGTGEGGEKGAAKCT